MAGGKTRRSIIGTADRREARFLDESSRLWGRRNVLKGQTTAKIPASRKLDFGDKELDEVISPLPDAGTGIDLPA